MKNEEYYKETFDEVHVPLNLLRKVRDMKMERMKVKKKSKLRYAISFAAAFAFCLIVSNGICYAATGETWISKVTYYINGEEMHDEITWHKEGDTIYGELEIEVPDDGYARVDYFEVQDTDDLDLENAQIEIYNYDTPEIKTEIITEGDRNILCINDQKIDITEDFADGSCIGTFEMDGRSMRYEVTGNIEEYTVSIMTLE